MKSCLTVIGFFAAFFLLFAILSSIFQSNKSEEQSAPEEKEEFVASIPYEGGQPAKAKQWVMVNINKPGTIDIGRVRFTLYVPTKWVRMLTIEGI